MFCSSGGRFRGYPSEVVELNTMIELGVVCIEPVHYRIPRALAKSSPLFKTYRMAFSDSTSQLHAELKWVAWNWLKEQGEDTPMYEQAYPGGKADVNGPMLRVVIECGDTTADKTIATPRNSEYAAWVILPYPSEIAFYLSDQTPDCVLTGYRFHRVLDPTAKGTGK
jgi:hypothetical protein